MDRDGVSFPAARGELGFDGRPRKVDNRGGGWSDGKFAEVVTWLGTLASTE